MIEGTKSAAPRERVVKPLETGLEESRLPGQSYF